MWRAYGRRSVCTRDRGVAAVTQASTAAELIAATDPTPESSVRVSTLELVFVFVFTLTQLTGVLVHHLDGIAVARVPLLFGVIWWMYGG